MEKILNNPILDKNLACIIQYNPKLVEDLISITALTNSISLIETDLKEPNMVLNGLLLHSQQGAEIEAKNIFSKVKNTPTTIHIVFGIGLGYLFQEFCQHSKGQVIVFEPNLEILRATLDIVDFSKELSQGNVKVVTNIDDFKQVFLSVYGYKYDANFSFLNSYKQMYQDNINDLVSHMELISGINISHFNTLKLFVANSIFMLLENLSYTLKETPLIEVKDAYKGKTALIVSAGPSLDNNIEAIKKNRDKFVIFCVGTALKALAAEGIKADFLNVIEVNDVSGQVKGVDLSDVNLILEPYTHNIFHQKETKNKFIFPTKSSHANNYWARLTGVDTSPYEAYGTVSYEALCSAKMLGFKKIILVGQDLAFINNQCYSKNSSYSDLKCEVNPETNKVEVKIGNYESYVESLKSEKNLYTPEVYERITNNKIKNITDTLFYVKGVTGEMLPSQGNYATFIEYFREFALNNKDLDLINASMIGANIEGFKNIPFEEAVADVEPIKDNIFLVEKHYEYDKNKILSNLDKEKTIFEEILKEFAKVDEYIFKYEREFARRRVMNEVTNKYFKLMLELYDKITNIYGIKSDIYQALAFNEEIELQYLIKNTEVVTLDSIAQAYTQLKNYYYMVGTKIKKVITKIDEQKGIIIESINSESN